MKYNRLSLVAAAASVCMFFACNSNKDYKTDDDTTSAITKQTAKEQESSVDTAAMNNGGSTAPPASTDTATSTPSAPVSTSTASTSKGSARPNPAKRGHKGTIRMAVYSKRMSGKMEADKNGVYNYTEVMPQYPGGEKSLAQYVQDHIQYPQDAIDNGVEGTVTVTFAVDETGRVTSPVLKGSQLGYGLDDEAKRVVDQMPKWTPGRVKGKAVKTYYDLPITFTLQ